MSFNKDTSAAIDVSFVHPDGDDYYNAQEVTALEVAITGTVTGVEDGQNVTLTISDDDPGTADIVLAAVISNGAFTVSDIDISSLTDGKLQSHRRHRGCGR